MIPHGVMESQTALRCWAVSERGPPAALLPRVSLRGAPSRAPLRGAVVRELERDPEVLRLRERDDGLEVVTVLARDPHLLLLDRGLDADLGVLDEAHDLLGLLHGDAVLERDALAHGSAGRGLGVLDRERLQVDAAAV